MTQTNSNTISHLTDEEREMLDRCEAATPGPWQHGRLDFETYDGAGERVMYVYRPIVTDKSHDHDIKLAGEGCVEDAVFIAHAREDIPTLLATIDQLRGELEESRKEYANIEALWGDMLNGADQVNAELAEGREALAELARVKGELERVRMERDELITLIRAQTHCSDKSNSCDGCPMNHTDLHIAEVDCNWDEKMRQITARAESAQESEVEG